RRETMPSRLEIEPGDARYLLDTLPRLPGEEQLRALLRALRLGFQSVQVLGASQPLLWREEKRTYLCMPLEAAGVVLPADDALRLVPDALDAPVPARPQPPRREPMPPRTPSGPRPQRNGARSEPACSPPAAPEQPGVEDLLEEAEAIRSLLHDAS